ncbi:maleate cis-trans isomerase family protein [Roseovarius salis]|uniref:maleate cis-trans isomerase family protein n=1 Tax=Roseovarius salis TaxID=3376063 RepID=UPI0037C68FD5
MNYELDEGAGAGLRLGLIVLSTDETLEYEARVALAGREANLLHTRIPAQADVTTESLATMAARMTESAALLPQGLDAVAYGCTSGATVIGPERVGALIRQAHPGVPTTDPMSAVIAALRDLGARRIAMVTPYLEEVTRPMRAHLSAHGIETVRALNFGERTDRTVARIAERSTRDAILEAGSGGGVDAVFTSCTNLRSFGVIEDTEARLGLPVISSNSALLWHLVGLSGQDGTGWGPGQLFQRAAA